MSAPLPIGTRTQWGPVSAVGITGGERYYWMLSPGGVVAMMPADVVEPSVRTAPTPTSESSVAETTGGET